MKMMYKVVMACVTAVSAMLSISTTAFALPNLTPYQPSGWSDKIVVARTTGTTTDSASLTSADTLYISWAVINNGTTATAASFITYLYVDGVAKASASTAAPFSPNTYSTVSSYQLGSLSVGTHTLKITADVNGTVAESDETDNSYTKTITVNSPIAPNLTPYQPTNWSDKIVVARNAGTTTDSTSLTTLDTLYVSWAIINNGNGVASNFTNSLYVDGTLKNSWSDASLGTNFYTYVNDYSIGSLSAGPHTITITADSGSNVSESNEADNSYTKNITILPPLPDLTKYSDSLTSTNLHAGDTVTASLTIQNQSCTSGSISAGTFHVGFYFSSDPTFNGVSSFHETAVSGCAANATVSLNQNLTVPAVTTSGTYYLGYKIDDQNEVTECNENNNGIFSWAVSVVSMADLTPQSISISPSPATVGSSVTVSYTVANLGGVAAPASHTKVQIKDSAQNLLTQQTFATAGIAAGSSTNENRLMSLTGATAGTYNAYVIVDNNSEVAQGSNTNNDASAGTAFTVQSQTGLVIIPIFDVTITNDAQAATIEATINSAIAAYRNNFSDPITVSIKFQEMSSGLGLSSAYINTFGYASYRAALVSHGTTSDDSAALAHLPGGTSNPVNGDGNITLKLPLARALGFSANPPAGQPDGTISLNTALMNLSAAQTSQTKYSLFAAVSHEIDEVLGFGSALNGLTNGAPSPTGAIEPEDLFRYDQNNVRSLTTDVNATSYFSIDAATDIAQFNQHQGGDFGDWYSYYGGQTPQVQDAYAAQGSAPVLGVELRVLDVIGYTRVGIQIPIVASAGSGGSINPSGSFNENNGNNQLFTATPNANFAVNQWLLDGTVVQTSSTNYTLFNIQTNHSVQVTFSAVATKTNQTITFASLSNKSYGEPPFAVSATASSGLPVSFAILSGPATISGSNVTLNGLGTVTVRASQSGNANYNPASNVDQAFTVYQPPTMSFSLSHPNVVITWPTNVAGYTLQSTTNIAVPAAWISVSPAPVIVNGQYTFTNTPAGGNKFYRLKK